MKKITKVLLVLLVALMMLPLTVSAVSDNETMSNNLSITISTDKNEYKVTNVAKITATITNTGSTDIENITAQAVFDELAPVSAKSSETNKNVAVLKPGESFSFTYKATLNSSKHNLNFFQKIILFLVRFFNGGYTINNIDFDVVTENVTEIKFGRFTAENVIQVGYSVPDDDNSDDAEDENTETTDEEFEEYLEVSENVENELSEIQLSEEYKNLTTLEKINYLRRYLNSLEKQGLIANIYYDESSIEFEYKNGISHLIIVENDHNSDCYSSIENGAERNLDEYTAYVSNSNEEYNTKWLFINGLGNFDENEKEASARLSSLASHYSKLGISITTIEKATVSTYKNINGYNLIYIVSHGKTTDFIKTPFIQTVEMVTKEKKKLYNEDLNAKNIATFEYKGAKYFRINPCFFENNYKHNELENSIISLSICRIFGTENKIKYDFATSLKNAGAETIIGFYNNANMYYADYLNEKILHFLTMGETIGKAFDKAISIIGNNSNEYRKLYLFQEPIDTPTYPVIVGNQNIKIFNNKLKSTILTIKVNDYTTKNAIEDVAVQIVNSGLRKFEKTNSEGNITIDLPEGIYTCYLSKENYAKKSIELEIGENAVTETIYLTSTTLTGTVTDSITGKPIPNVWVEATDNNDPYVSISDFTDENGYYSIPLESGSYVVGYSHNDYKVEVRDVDVGEQNPNIDIKLTPLNSSDIEDDTDDYYTVTYTVIDISTFDHISGVSVNVTKQYDETGKIIATATTDTNGSFTLKLPGGDYVLLFSHEDYETKDALRIINSDVDDGLIYLTPLEKRAEIASGDCGADGDNIKWVLYDDGELVISGSGKMTDYDWWSDTPWRSNKNSITAVTMSDDITYIGKYAFGECEKLKNVKLPQKLESIGESAFYHCHGIVQIDFPDSLRNIGKKAFWNSNGLEKVYIHQNIKNIGEEAFHACHKLKLIIVDKNNKYYLSDEYGVLFDKNKETLIQYPLDSDNTTYSIPSSVKTIGVGAFSGGKNLKNINIPIGVETIEDDAFSSCDSLVTIDIPHTVKKLGKKIFYSCENLTSIKVPNTITIIEEYSFTDCKNLVNIEIPDSINQIRWHAFEGTAYYNDPKNWNNGSLYLGNHLIKVDSSVSGSYVIKEGTLTIADKAFENCSDITEISFPDTLVYIGEWSFSFCSGLTSITIPSSVTFIGDVAFNSCTNLTNVIFEDGIGSTTIGEFSFQDCKNIENIVFGNTVENIEWYAFCHCTNIKSITISTSLKNVANSVFYNSNTSIDIYYKGSQEQWDEINIGYNNYYLTNSTIHYNS